MMEKLKVGLQYWLPKHALTRLVGKFASAEAGKLTTAVIRQFIKFYKVNMNEALYPDPAHYKTFNAFFTRELTFDARPLVQESSVYTHPADGTVSQFGPIVDNALIQAKGHTYTTLELLGGDTELANQFSDGGFATIYLSPRDYHRVHMPCDGTLREMIYIPGDLFSVNPLTAENVPNLFARNERVVCIFDTAAGPMAQILVGATIVGSIEVVWGGIITPPAGNTIHRWRYPSDGDKSVQLHKGEEMGRFQLGSTVINLFAKDAVYFDESMIIGRSTRYGQAYAHKP